MQVLGFILIGLGVASIVGGGVTPNNFSALLDGYRRAKLEEREPTLEERWAYSNHIAHRVGIILAILGGLICFVAFFIEGSK